MNHRGFRAHGGRFRAHGGRLPAQPRQLPSSNGYGHCETQPRELLILCVGFALGFFVLFIYIFIIARSSKGAWGFNTGIFLPSGSQGLVKSPRQARGHLESQLSSLPSAEEFVGFLYFPVWEMCLSQAACHRSYLSQRETKASRAVVRIQRDLQKGLTLTRWMNSNNQFGGICMN